jgi:glycyl-tRNA synthetase (class II)
MPGALTAPREFNLMFQTSVGAMADGSSVAYVTCLEHARTPGVTR